MRRTTLAAVLIGLAATPAMAQSETDRLRDAVRTMTGQLRALEDQRAQTQARLAQVEREKTQALQAADRLRGQLKDTQKALQETADEANRRLAARDETLEKWKSAYEEAATVARDKDALRAKFELEAANFKARTKSCEAKNVNLLKVNSDILEAYRELTPLDQMIIREPLIGIGRVPHQNKVQDLKDRILDQDARLPTPAPTPAPTPTPTADAAAKPTPGRATATSKPAAAGASAAPNDQSGK
jgi:chromosome segregation ATPase